MELIKFLKENDNWREILTQSPYCLSIKEKDNYAIFKYNQLESDMSLRIVQESRGVIIDLNDYTVACRAFDKFFNVQEPYAAKLTKNIKALEKVDGCFPYQAKVLLSNGDVMSIGEIVNGEKAVEVLSYNVETGKIEPKKVVGWNRKKSTKDEWIIIETEKLSSKLVPHDLTNKCIQTTKNHIFFKQGDEGSIEEIPAEFLREGDIIFSPFKDISNKEKQIILGGMLGDFSFNNYVADGTMKKVRTVHSKKQKEYVKYLEGLLKRLKHSYKDYEVKNSYGKEKSELYLWAHKSFEELYNICCCQNKKSVSKKWLDLIGDLGMAIWYMDDGSLLSSCKNNAIALHTEGFSFEENKIIQSWFEDNGYRAYIRDNKKGHYFITLSTSSSELVWRKIRKYICPAMQYKLPERHQGFFEEQNIKDEQPIKLSKNKIVKIKNGIMESKMNQGMMKFDIEIEDNHNYFVDGIMVHNSIIKAWIDRDSEVRVSTNGMIDAADADILIPVDGIKTYRDLFDRALKNNRFELDYFKRYPGYTFIFELVSPLNRIVVPYQKTELYFLGVRNNKTLQEWLPYDFEDKTLTKHFSCPRLYDIQTVEQAIDVAKTLGADKEGFVLVDENFNRVKVKGSEYLAMHLLRNNTLSQRNFLEAILENKQDDLVAFFPEYEPFIRNIEKKMNNYIKNVESALKMANYDLNKKDFALEVLSNEYMKDYSNILFKVYGNRSYDWKHNTFNIKNMNKVMAILEL